MSDKYKGIYRSDSFRLNNWEYRSSAAYFITICTRDREHFFGHIRDGKMHLSQQGVIADLIWHEIKNHTTNTDLGEFVVMPDHIHGILILNENGVVTKNQKMSAISPKPGSVSTIIRSYKSAVTKHCNRLGFPFAWQPLFYDHIIRDDESYQRIAE
jgi:REP element-mobilizing transposase RayT